MVSDLTLVKYGVAVLLIAGAFLGGELQGRHSVKLTDQVKQQAQVIQVQAISAKDQASVDAAGQKFAQLVGQNHVIVQKQIVKVPVYVTKQDDSRCTVNTGFVSLWNAANAGQVPDANVSASAAEAPSGVKLSDVAAQHATESGYTHDLENQLNALLDSIQSQQENHSTHGN